MKRIFKFIILIALTACTALQTQPVVAPVSTQSPDASAGELPQASIPNPASIYCTEQGNKLEIHTAADGSQSGVCIFPDGSECDEWAYYQEECGLATQTNPTPDITVDATTEEVVDWWGVIKSTESGAQYDDYFERQDLGQIIYFGIDSLNPAVKSQIEALRDSGKIVHLYGVVVSNVPDYNGSQIQVDRIEVEE
jgi:uncharacterized protein